VLRTPRSINLKETLLNSRETSHGHREIKDTVSPAERAIRSDQKENKGVTLVPSALAE